MSTMSLTKAIRESAGYVSIHGRGTSWTVIGPHKVLNLGGPTTSWNCDSYPKARRCATQWRAEIALVLMGVLNSENNGDVAMELDYHRHDGFSHTLRDYIDAGLRAAG